MLACSFWKAVMFTRASIYVCIFFFSKHLPFFIHVGKIMLRELWCLHNRYKAKSNGVLMKPHKCIWGGQTPKKKTEKERRNKRERERKEGWKSERRRKGERMEENELWETSTNTITTSQSTTHSLFAFHNTHTYTYHHNTLSCFQLCVCVSLSIYLLHSSLCPESFWVAQTSSC